MTFTPCCIFCERSILSPGIPVMVCGRSLEARTALDVCGKYEKPSELPDDAGYQ